MENLSTPGAPAPAMPAAKGGMSWSVGVLLFLAGLIVGGAVIWFYAQPSGAPEAEILPTVSPTAEAGDPLAGWKTYTAERHGYAFRYPAELDFFEHGEQSVIVDTPSMVETFRRLAEGPGSGAPNMFFSVYVSYAYEFIPESCGTDEDGTPFERVAVSVGGLSTHACEIGSMEGPDAAVYAIYLEYNDALYFITMGDYEGAGRTTTDQILSSFVFTE